MKKLICFDLDGTLTTTSTWESFNTTLGITQEEDHRLFSLFREGSIDYSGWIASLVEIYKRHDSVTKADIVTLANSIELRPDAKDTIRSIQEMGYEVVLISGGVDIIVGTIAASLGIQHWYATNRAIWNPSDELISVEPMGDERSAKLALLEAYCENHGDVIEDVICVGDGGNDIDLFKKAKGILLGTNKDLMPLAWKQVERLSEVVNLM
jgi:HAD superfamily phosphoserine phosphatase-like hydrolase